MYLTSTYMLKYRERNRSQARFLQTWSTKHKKKIKRLSKFVTRNGICTPRHSGNVVLGVRSPDQRAAIFSDSVNILLCKTDCNMEVVRW